MDKVLILAGGYSNEREISLITAKSVIYELKKIKKYKLLLIEPDGSFVKKLRKFQPNLVLNLLHGRYGEDGYIQSILESEKIRYSHSGVLSSSLAIDKEISKKIFIKNNILTPPYIKFSFKNGINIKSTINKIDKNIKFPVVLKPINEGSSVGVYICNKKNFYSNLMKLEKFRDILIEKYIPGREIQAAILGKKKLGIIELKPKRKFYDYKAKYNANAKTEHIIPVDLSLKNFNKINSIALKAHKLLKCRGVSRSDFRFYNNKFYLLEINTQPGMTSLSLVPEIARYKNISFIELIEEIMKDASINK
mgnify:CR=1 FL=1|tara:strand:+ start:327 stop:1247 length:921 start_codon:yes stop_codon:yes gene_type:complete